MKTKVYLVVRPTFRYDAFQSFLAHQGTTWQRTQSATEAEELVEAAGRMCYMSFGAAQSPRTNPEYLANLIRLGHESVLEHVTWGFVLTGVSRSFTHQLVRHRVGIAISQLSQQYHDESSAAFVAPVGLESSEQAVKAWQRAVEVAKSSYREILAVLEAAGDVNGLGKKEFRRRVRSIARSVLPNATETMLFVCANARTLRYLFEVRGSIAGDEEMRRVMAEIFLCVEKEAPQLFSDFHLETLPDGSPILRKIATPAP